MPIASSSSAVAFRAYQLANLHFPQMDVGVVSLVGHALLQGTLSQLETGLNDDLSVQQKARMMTAMERAHRANGVRALPAGAVGAAQRHVITEARLTSLWFNVRLYITQAIGEVACALDRHLAPLVLRPGATHQEAIADLVRVLDDTQLRAKLTRVFAALVDSLRGPQSSQLAREYREAIRTSGAGYADAALSAIRTDVETRLSILLADAVRPICDRAGDLIATRRWIPLRRSPMALALVTRARDPAPAVTSTGTFP